MTFTRNSLRVFAALVAAVVLASSPALAAFPQFPAASGGGSGTVTTSSPVSGDGSIGTPVTVANGALGLPKLASQAASTLIGNATGSGAVPTTVPLGTGLTFSAGSLVNSAPFAADTILTLPNSAAAQVNAWEGKTTLVSNTAAAETSNYIWKLLNAGVAFTALDMEPTGWLGVNTASTNLNANAGSSGITVVAPGTSPAVLELKKTTSGATLAAEIDMFNGASGATVAIQGTNNIMKLYAGTGPTLAVQIASTGPSSTLSWSSANSVPFLANKAGTQQIDKQGSGDILLGNSVAAGHLTFYTSASLNADVTALDIDGNQVINFGAASAAANASVATVLGSVGPVGSHTTVQGWLSVKVNGVAMFFPGF